MVRSFDQIEALHIELDGASDRAAAIVAGAFLDELLQNLLCAFFIKGTSSTKKLFEGTGALATFSAKIEMSFRLGLISECEHRTLTTIRVIRNDFAHVAGDLSFASQSVQARCRNIEVPLAMVAPRDIPLSQNGETPTLPRIEKASSDNPRAVFQEAVITLMDCLSARVANAGEIQRQSPPCFNAAHEPGLARVNRMKSFSKRLKTLAQNENLSADEREFVTERLKKNELLVEVEEFCLQQITRVHKDIRDKS